MLFGKVTTKYFSFIILFILLFALPSNIASADKKLKYKIAVIHSYDINHACTFPQQVGFLDTLANYKDDIFNVRVFFMDAKTGNTTREKQEISAKMILSKLAESDYDFFYTTDDLAFELVGVPLLKAGKKVFASGINKTVSEYVIDLNFSTNNLIACEEAIIIDDLLKIFKDSNIEPANWYILHDDTETSYYMIQNYKREFNKHGIPNFTLLKITTIDKLESTIRNIQRDNNGVIVVTLQRLYNDYGEVLNKERFIGIIKKYNKKHIEITGNPLYAKLGFSIASGPDFEDMGNIMAKKLIEVVEGKQFKHMICTPNTKTAINLNRLNELNYKYILDKTRRFIKIYEK